ncbi:MAG: hypothetical protein IH845_04825 [Nanoarchaeota archaeon]|nr:hypothetical protein [Nanoarchaeota archaeon]
MLTPYLENLIHKGEARFRTFVCGQSGSNVLPVKDNTWVIITGFTYCNFSDPERPPFPPIQFDQYVARSIHQLRFRSSKSNNHYILKDNIIREPGSPGSDINLIVNGDFTNGENNWTFEINWAVVAAQAVHTGLLASPDTIFYNPLTSIGGRKYRLTYEIIAVAGTGSIQPFVGNTAGFVRSTVGTFTEEITAASTLAPGLRMTASGGLGNNITIDNIELILLPSEETILINGHYKFDCYLPHQNEVTVELVSFLENPNIALISAVAPASIHIPAPPVGYGNVGFGGISQVTEFRSDIGGFLDIDLALTRIHTDPAVVPGDIIQNGMEIGVSIGTAINAPFFDDRQEIRNFPIIDIQYVEIEGNMPGHIQASN